MHRKTPHKRVLAVLAVLLLAEISGGKAQAGASEDVDYTEMSAEDLAEYLIFKANGFDTDMKTQEGATVRARLQQDKLQETCSELKGGQIDSATAQKVTELARESMTYPDGGIELGDWKKGQTIAENAYGYRVGHKIDDHDARQTGGLCINCHQMEKEKKIRSGTLGPSLINYGETRGVNEQAKQYTYEVIYNPHQFFPCTKMPRFGANDFLSQEKIAHIMAYLLDPESPVNQ